jgi:dipeptide transport system permease protein
MLRFVLQRVLLIIPTFLGAALLTFTLIHSIPGDPVQMLLGEKVVEPARHAELLHQMGLDRPLYVQFFDYIWHVMQGDFGKSIVTKNGVLDDFFSLFPATLELALCAMVFAVVLAIPAGVLAAEKRGSVYDHALMGAALTGYSMPIFWWGLLLNPGLGAHRSRLLLRRRHRVHAL